MRQAQGGQMLRIRRDGKYLEMSEEDWNKEREIAQMARNDKIWQRALRIVKKYGEKSVSENEWYGRTTSYNLSIPIEVTVEEKTHISRACSRECCGDKPEYTIERTEFGYFGIRKSQYLTGGDKLLVSIGCVGEYRYMPLNISLYEGNVDNYENDPRLIRLNNSSNSPWLYVRHYKPFGTSALTESWQTWLDGRKLRPAIDRAMPQKKQMGTFSLTAYRENL